GKRQRLWRQRNARSARNGNAPAKPTTAKSRNRAMPQQPVRKLINHLQAAEEILKDNRVNEFHEVAVPSYPKDVPLWPADKLLSPALREIRESLDEQLLVDGFCA